MHPAVRFLALSDVSDAQLERLGTTTQADVTSTDALEVVRRAEVDTVIVSTPEDEHVEIALAAIAAGKHVLIEKPLATTSSDGLRIVRAAEQAGVELRVGYSQRFRRETFLAKQHLQAGRLGRFTGGTVRVANSRAQAFAIMERVPHVSIIVDILTYWVDIASWLMDGAVPVEVVAMGGGDVLRSRTGPSGPDDLTTAVVRYDNGAVISYTVCYALPAEFPTQGQSIRIELFGADGYLVLDDDRRGSLIFTDHGVPHAYVSDHLAPMAYLGTTTSGDWAMGTMFGPIADETRSWLDHLATGSPTQLATPSEAMLALEVTLAMERSAREGRPVRFDAAVLG
jgi:predicted dehydrogenase